MFNEIYSPLGVGGGWVAKRKIISCLLIQPHILYRIRHEYND